MSSLLGNSLAILVARVLLPVCSLAINIGIARIYGDRMLGAYVQLVSILLILQSAAGAGMVPLLARELAAHPGDAVRLLRTSRSLGAVMGILAMLAFIAIGAAMPMRPPTSAVVVLSVTLVPSAWISVNEAFFIGTCTHSRVTVVALVENVVKAALAAVAFAVGGGLGWLCAGIAVARVAALIVGHLFVRGDGVRGAWRPKAAGVWPLAQAVAPFAGMLTIAMLYFRVDVLVVGAVRGVGAAGLYGSALALYSAALLLPDSLMAAAYPRLSAQFESSRGGYARASFAVARLLTAVIVPATVLLVAAAEPVLRFLYGQRFEAAGPTLRLLALSLPIHGVNAVLGQALQAGHFQRSVLKVVTSGLALHVALNVIFVSMIGINGAPLALLISASAVALGNAVVFHRHVASVVPSARTLAWAVALLGGLGLTALTPSEYRIAAAAVALALTSAAVLHALRHADLKAFSLMLKAETRVVSQ